MYEHAHVPHILDQFVNIFQVFQISLYQLFKGQRVPFNVCFGFFLFNFLALLCSPVLSWSAFRSGNWALFGRDARLRGHS